MKFEIIGNSDFSKISAKYQAKSNRGIRNFKIHSIELKWIFLFIFLLFRWNYFQWVVNRVLNIYLFIFCCCRFVLLTIVILIELRLWHNYGMRTCAKRHDCLICLFRMCCHVCLFTICKLIEWFNFCLFVTVFWMQFVQQQQEQKRPNVHMEKAF